MVTIILSLLGWAILDSLNPSTIATMILLMPMVKKRSHAWLYIGTTFLIYYLFGIFSFLGANRYLIPFFSRMIDRLYSYLGWIEVLAAAAMLLSSLRMIFYVLKKWKLREPLPDLVGRTARYVTPLSLIALACVSTLADLPTALPYGAFIATLVAMKDITTLEIVFLLFYCFIYILPMALVYFVFIRLNTARYERLQTTFKRVMNAVGSILLPLLLIGFGIWLLLDGTKRLLAN